jgi:hypothetical protein
VTRGHERDAGDEHDAGCDPEVARALVGLGAVRERVHALRLGVGRGGGIDRVVGIAAALQSHAHAGEQSDADDQQRVAADGEAEAEWIDLGLALLLLRVSAWAPTW